MEQLAELEKLIQTYAPQAVIFGLMGLGALVVMGYAYVAATPSKDDDMWLQKLEQKPVVGWALKLLLKFAPIQRK